MHIITPDGSVPPGSSDAAWPPGLVTPADRERFARYAEARAFYEGAQWAGRRRRGETRLTANYARALVRKIASYVFPAPVTFSVPAPTPDLAAAAARAELALARVAGDLDLARLDVELATESAVLGDAALKVTWDAIEGTPVVAAVDPAGLIVQTAPDNPRRIEEIAQLYGLTGAASDRLFGTAGRGTAGEGAMTVPAGKARPGGKAEVAGMARVIGLGLDPDRVYPVVETWTADRWRVTVAGQPVRDEANPYGWLPYVLAPNDPRPYDAWGGSDLRDLYDVCRELNARLTVLSRVLELSGAPIAVLENVDGSEGITVGPGAKWELPEGAKAYLLDLLGGGGVDLHIKYIDLLYRAIHDLSETPRTAFGDAGRDLSGAALEVEIQPLIQRVGRKRRGWDSLYRARNTRLLDLLERFGGEDLGGLRRSHPIWPGVLPSDRDGAVRNAVSLVAAGIHSRRTAVAALGGEDPEGELERVLEEGVLLGAEKDNKRAGGEGTAP